MTKPPLALKAHRASPGDLSPGMAGTVRPSRNGSNNRICRAAKRSAGNLTYSGYSPFQARPKRTTAKNSTNLLDILVLDDTKVLSLTIFIIFKTMNYAS